MYSAESIRDALFGLFDLDLSLLLLALMRLLVLDLLRQLRNTEEVVHALERHALQVMLAILLSVSRET